MIGYRAAQQLEAPPHRCSVQPPHLRHLLHGVLRARVHHGAQALRLGGIGGGKQATCWRWLVSITRACVQPPSSLRYGANAVVCDGRPGHHFFLCRQHVGIGFRQLHLTSGSVIMSRMAAAAAGLAATMLPGKDGGGTAGSTGIQHADSYSSCLIASLEAPAMATAPCLRQAHPSSTRMLSPRRACPMAPTSGTWGWFPAWRSSAPDPQVWTAPPTSAQQWREGRSTARRSEALLAAPWHSKLA